MIVWIGSSKNCVVHASFYGRVRTRVAMTAKWSLRMVGMTCDSTMRHEEVAVSAGRDGAGRVRM